MHVGYARVSTREQTIDLQVDALTQAGCTNVYTEVISGARAERPILAQVLEMLRAGDVLVIWKLDRLGRSLTHLLTIVTDLMTRQVGLKSLNDPIDTTTPQGRLILNLFAALAECEREVMRERTQAGLSAARARGRRGGRPKGLPRKAEATAYAAETLYREGRLSAQDIADKLHISKSTLYAYLRARGVPIGTARHQPMPPTTTPLQGRRGPTKQISAEALLALHRRLATLPPRSHERRLVMQNTAGLYGVSEPTLYRALAARGRPTIVRRVDRGTPRVLPQEQLERYCELIAAIKVRTSNKKQRHLSTGEAIRLLEEFGLETPDGFVRAPKGRLTRTTVNRYLQQWGFDRTRLLRQPAAVRFQAEHSNDGWQFDLSPSDLKAVKEPSWVRPAVGAPTLMLFSVVDDRRGVAYQEYHCVYGEDVEAARRFLFNAMAPKPMADFPFHGIPRMIDLDNGPIAKSQVFQQVMRQLDVDVRPHLPQGKDGQRVTARSKGKVERPFRTVQEMHETLYHFHEPKDEAEANAWLMHFLVRYNGMQHRSEPHSRLDDWRQHLPPSGVRAICSWERFCTFARAPERRKVGIDARVSVAGVSYEVDPNLAGETVVLWWGRFDNELYVEHGERRFGPYAPIGGPIPLHRYRTFKKTPTPRRAERLEALAGQLALPRAALEGHPHADAFAPTTEVPAIPFADPDPFQEFAQPTVLMAKRAIADELGLPLAKLSPAQRAQIDAILATTLKKTEVMAQVRAHIHAATAGGTPC